MFSDPEDSTWDGDGKACEVINGSSACRCGHDLQSEFGIALVDHPVGANTSFGKVSIDDTAYGATARPPHNNAHMYFDVDSSLMQSANSAVIKVIYKLDGAPPTVLYKKNGVDTTATSLTGPTLLTGNWYEATFLAPQPEFDNPGHSYDLAIDVGSGYELDRLCSGRTSNCQSYSDANLSTLRPRRQRRPLHLSPDFAEPMETAPPAAFDSSWTSNGATLTTTSDRIEGNYAWQCQEGSQLQNWPECSATEWLPATQDKLTIEYGVKIDAATQLEPALWGSGGLLWPYLDLSNQLHIYCSATMCGELLDYIPGHALTRGVWHRIRIQVDATGQGNTDSIIVTAYDSVGAPLWTHSITDLSLNAGFSTVQMFTRFGINNNWDEVAYWDDFRTWWGVVPETAIVTEPLHPFGHVPQLAALQHGTDGYYAAQDTYIVTSNWEPPTLHDTFPVLYVRTNSAEPEIMSSLIGFDNISLPYSAFPVHATLSLYYLGQSVNGGDITVHVAGVEPEWIASQTTWTHYRSGYPWQIPGAKGSSENNCRNFAGNFKQF